MLLFDYLQARRLQFNHILSRKHKSPKTCGSFATILQHFPSHGAYKCAALRKTLYKDIGKEWYKKELFLLGFAALCRSSGYFKFEHCFARIVVHAFGNHDFHFVFADILGATAVQASSPAFWNMNVTSPIPITLNLSLVISTAFPS